MRGFSTKSGALLSAVLYAAAPSAAAHACSINTQSLWNGSSAVDSIPMALHAESSIKIDLSSARDCFIRIYVEKPTRVMFSVQPVRADASSPLEFRVLRRVFDGDDVTLVTFRLSEAQRSTPNVDLISGEYYLDMRLNRLPNRDAAPAVTRQATHRFTIVSTSSIPLRELMAAKGEAQTVQLDRYSGDAFLTFAPHNSIEVDIDLDLSNVPPNLRDSIRINLMDQKGRLYAAEFFEMIPGGKRYHYILNRRVYRLEVSQIQNHWPRTPLTNADVEATIKVQVANIRSHSLPSGLANLSDWLSQIGLGDTIEVLEIYDLENDRDRLAPQLRDEYGAILKQISDDRMERIKRNKDAWGADFRPRYLVRMRALASREKIGEIESKIWSRGHISLWDRMLRKISLSTNIPSRKIAILMPVYCSGGLIYEEVPGEADRHGLVCMMASAAVKLEDLGIQKLSQTGLGKAPDGINLSDVADKFLSKFLPAADSKIQYLANGKDFVDAIVRGLRGQVVKGGTEWEKTEISIVKSGNSEIRFFVDGLLASGIGGYPPDSQFTKDMEADHARAVTDYAKALATSFGDYLRQVR